MERQKIAVLATLDTKGDEAAFISELLEVMSVDPVIVDIGIRGQASIEADISRSEILEGAELVVDSLATLDKSEAMEAAVRGAIAVLSSLIREGALAGIIAVGGGQGTWMSATIMRSLPIGFPKVLVSTIAHRIGAHIAGTDIVVFPSITDLSGVNRLVAPTLRYAAATVTNMASASGQPAADGRPLLAMTMFGVTTRGGQAVQKRLIESGYEVAIFHANGPGGRIMERLVDEGEFLGVLDWTITELIDELVGGIASAGSERLSAAGKNGTPQLVVPGAIDVINYGARDTVPEGHRRNRVLHEHTPQATLMRSSADENRELGKVVATKLNAAKGPTAVLVPLGGFSELDSEGGPFWDEEADAAFVESLREHLSSSVSYTEINNNINEGEFAAQAAESFLTMLP